MMKYDIFMNTYQPKINNKLSASEVDKTAFEIVKNQLIHKPHSVLILPTGGTQIGWYKLIVDAHKRGKIDFAEVTIFNLDEYYPLNKDNPSSYYSYMRKNLIDHINIKPENWHIPNCEAETSEKAVSEYQNFLNGYEKFDLAVLGIGPATTCHIGFNEQGSDEKSKTRYAILDEQTSFANSVYFKNPNDMPKGAITMGISDILKAENIILLAKEREKTWGIQRTLLGPINKEAPASYLRFHPNVTFIIDKEAASLL